VIINVRTQDIHLLTSLHKRDALQANRMPGPRIRRCGVWISPPNRDCHGKRAKDISTLTFVEKGEFYYILRDCLIDCDFVAVMVF